MRDQASVPHWIGQIRLRDLHNGILPRKRTNALRDFALFKFDVDFDVVATPISVRPVLLRRNASIGFETLAEV